MAIEGIYKNKIDWEAISGGLPMVVENYNGLKICVEKFNDEAFLSLYLDSDRVMTTRKHEHDIMKRTAATCPQNSRCLIGGFGFGIILLYLAERPLRGEVIIIEKDKRVMKKIVPNIEAFLHSNYPNFNFKVIEGDIYEEILKNGLFDWIFIDISDGSPKEFEELSKKALKTNGIFVPFQETIE